MCQSCKPVFWPIRGKDYSKCQCPCLEIDIVTEMDGGRICQLCGHGIGR